MQGIIVKNGVLLKIKTVTEITAYCYHGSRPKSAPKVF